MIGERGIHITKLAGWDSLVCWTQTDTNEAHKCCKSAKLTAVLVIAVTLARKNGSGNKISSVFRRGGIETAMYEATEDDKLISDKSSVVDDDRLRSNEREAMKLKHIAALMMLMLALGCTQQPAATPATDAGSDSSAGADAAASTTVDPATDTDTLVASATTVKFDVTGMT